MKGMFLLSSILHLVCLTLFVYLPEFRRKEIVYTPVYTVDLLTLPQVEPPGLKTKPKKKARVAPLPEIKRKPLEFKSSLPEQSTLKKLKTFENKFETTEKAENETEKIKESSLSNMLTELEKSWETRTPEKPEEKSEPQDDLLEKLTVMEEKWDVLDQEKEKEREEKSAEALEKLNSLKYNKEINLRQAQVDSQAPQPVVPPHLNRYYALILSRIHENWLNPLSTKVKELSPELPGVAYFKIKPNGEISHITVEESSGNDMLDSLIQEAIENSSPLPPPPEEYLGKGLEVYLDFKYVIGK